MNEIFRIIYTTVADSLFPLSKAEKEVLSYSPEHAFATLSHVSSLSNVTIPHEYLEHLSAIFAYQDERVSRLIWNIKYKKSSRAIAIGAYALFMALRSIPPLKKGVPRVHEGRGIFLIPMPMTAKRRRERGFNQCEYLADAIKKLDKENLFIVKTDLLVRTLHADRQTLKGREERMQDAKGIFAVDKNVARQFIIHSADRRTQFKNAPLVIVDDVITTGSTMKEAIDTLRSAGFGEVYGLGLAH